MRHGRIPGGALLLLPLVLAVQAPGDDDGRLAKRLQELEQRLGDEQRSWLEFLKQARSEEERSEVRAAFPRDEFVDQLGALAAEAQGTEVAARAWLDAFRLAVLLDDRALFGRAVERLLADHLQSPRIAELALDLVYGAPSWSAQPAAQALRRIVAGSADPVVVASALAELALLVGLDDAFGAAGRTEAEALLARIEREFGTQDFIGMSGKQFAAGARFEMDHLRIGQVAPDFEATDQDGVRFKLSDHRGRVVVLDFWGFV